MLVVVAVQLRLGLCQFITMGVSVDVQNKQFTFVMCRKDVDGAGDRGRVKMDVCGKWNVGRSRMFVRNRRVKGCSSVNGDHQQTTMEGSEIETVSKLKAFISL